MSISAADAYEIPATLSEIALPIATLELVETFAGRPEVLGERVDEQRAQLTAGQADLVAQFDRLDAAIARAGLAVAPPRPTSFATYQTYAQGVLASVAAAAPPESPERAIVLLGRAVGEVLQSMGLHALVLHLIDAAPDDPELFTREDQVREARPGLVQRLNELATSSGLSDELKATVQKLVQIAKPTAPLPRGPAPGQIAALRAAMQQIDAEVGASRRHLSPR